MVLFYRPARAEISLDAFRHNLHALRGLLPQGMRMMAVVKANAYGHGAYEIAQEAVACGVDYIGVAFLDEAVYLRKAGISAPILVLGYTPPEGASIARELAITVTVYSEEVLYALSRAGEAGQPVKIHIKIDTGMGRIGLRGKQDAISFIEKALRTRGVAVEGLFTHFACADQTDKSCSNAQFGRFDEIATHFAGKGVRFPYLHTGNSATAIDMPELSYNMIRLGISLYGLYPSAEVKRERVDLKPVMSLKSEVVMLWTQRTGTIAILPFGYADGFPRQLSGKANVLIRGRMAPVAGNICMDQCMIDVAEIPNGAVGDEAVLLGQQGDLRIHAGDWADAMGTISYEVTCRVASRVPRIYVRDGQIIKVVNALNQNGACLL
ncbi:alanine racemase [Paenibacillus silvisoli]|uniref:alanine racemase n=1 Tax=Paenibacillus silvisoli TaxID=3110539 RepID=UPI002805EA52|nr:alanine racemase [Paenibacillus silvisoli]